MNLDRWLSPLVATSLYLGSACSSPQIPAVNDVNPLDPNNPIVTTQSNSSQRYKEGTQEYSNPNSSLCETECPEGFNPYLGPTNDVCENGQQGCIENGMTLDQMQEECKQGVVTAISRYNSKTGMNHLFWTCIPQQDIDKCGIYGYLVQGEDSRTGNIVEACWDEPSYRDVQLSCKGHGSEPIKTDCNVLGKGVIIPMWDCGPSDGSGETRWLTKCLRGQD